MENIGKPLENDGTYRENLLKTDEHGGNYREDNKKWWNKMMEIAFMWNIWKPQTFTLDSRELFWNIGKNTTDTYMESYGARMAYEKTL